MNTSPNTVSEDVLAAVDLSAAYGRIQVLFGVNLALQPGELVALVGANGAGKSSLLRALAGFLTPCGGAVRLAGRDVTGADPRVVSQRGLALVPPEKSVFASLSVADNLRIAAWNLGHDAAAVTDATERVLAYFPRLRERWHLAAGDLSGGEQQMLSLAAAFLSGPDVLLIDELSLGLAPLIVERLFVIVRELNNAGTAVLLVEQSVGAALHLAPRAVVLEKGEIRYDGPSDALATDPDLLRSLYLAEGATRAPSRSTPLRTTTAPVPPVPPAKVLEVLGLTKTYGSVTAVRDVTFDVAAGEIVGLIGPNGAGKTTVFDLISGFSAPNGGQVHLRGHDVTSWKPHRRARLGLGRSFQAALLWPSLTVREAIAVAHEPTVEVTAPLPALLGLPIAADSEAAVADRTDELLATLGLEAYRDVRVGDLSTGTRRVVEIGAQLAAHPKVLLLDEPSSGISRHDTARLAALLLRVRDELEASLVLTEHDMGLVRELADRLVALDLGEVVTIGNPDDVLVHPRVLESYLGNLDPYAANAAPQ